MKNKVLGWLILICLANGSSVVLGATPAQGDRPSLSNGRILFLGDSITAGGHYVSFIEYYLNKRHAQQQFDIISIGLSSETVSGLSETDHPFPRPCLHERLGRALAAIKPRVVVACYGMNDGIYHPQSPERMEAFQDGIEQLMQDVHKSGGKVVLLTPPPFDPVPVSHKLRPDDAPDYSYKNPYYRYHSVLEDYSSWIMGLGSRAGVYPVDLNTPLIQYIAGKRRHDPSFRFSGDGIHPSQAGHLLMAREILKGLGITIESSDLDQELERILADPLFGLVNRHRKIRSSGWLDYVGYTRGKTVKKPSVESTEQQASALQLEIDRMRKNTVATPVH
jgi:lysophospholipase L1-like esterase